MNNDHKVKPLHITVMKASAYVKSYDGQTKWMYFLIEDYDLLEKIILFRINSALIQRKSLIESLSKIKNF